MLPSLPDDFGPGSRDTFRVQLPALGELQRLELRMDSAGEEAAWHLDSVQVLDKATGDFLPNGQGWMDPSPTKKPTQNPQITPHRVRRVLIMWFTGCIREFEYGFVANILFHTPNSY